MIVDKRAVKDIAIGANSREAATSAAYAQREFHIPLLATSRCAARGAASTSFVVTKVQHRSRVETLATDAGQTTFSAHRRKFVQDTARRRGGMRAARFARDLICASVFLVVSGEFTVGCLDPEPNVPPSPQSPHAADAASGTPGRDATVSGALTDAEPPGDSAGEAIDGSTLHADASEEASVTADVVVVPATDAAFDVTQVAVESGIDVVPPGDASTSDAIVDGPVLVDAMTAGDAASESEAATDGGADASDATIVVSIACINRDNKSCSLPDLALGVCIAGVCSTCIDGAAGTTLCQGAYAGNYYCSLGRCVFGV